MPRQYTAAHNSLDAISSLELDNFYIPHMAIQEFLTSFEHIVQDEAAIWREIVKTVARLFAIIGVLVKFVLTPALLADGISR
jgi:hypothetical protein